MRAITPFRAGCEACAVLIERGMTLADARHLHDEAARVPLAPGKTWSLSWVANYRRIQRQEPRRAR